MHPVVFASAAGGVPGQVSAPGAPQRGAEARGLRHASWSYLAPILVKQLCKEPEPSMAKYRQAPGSSLKYGMRVDQDIIHAWFSAMWVCSMTCTCIPLCSRARHAASQGRPALSLSLPLSDHQRHRCSRGKACLVFGHVGVQAHALVLARQLGGLHHEVLGDREGGAGRQAHAQHGVPARHQLIGQMG